MDQNEKLAAVDAAKVTVQTKRIALDDLRASVQSTFLLVEDVSATVLSAKDRITWLQSIQDTLDARLVEVNDIASKL